MKRFIPALALFVCVSATAAPLTIPAGFDLVEMNAYWLLRDLPEDYFGTPMAGLELGPMPLGLNLESTIDWATFGLANSGLGMGGETPSDPRAANVLLWHAEFTPPAPPRGVDVPYLFVLMAFAGEDFIKGVTYDVLAIAGPHWGELSRVYRHEDGIHGRADLWTEFTFVFRPRDDDRPPFLTTREFHYSLLEGGFVFAPYPDEPIPEPATWLLTGLGTIGLCAIGRRLRPR